MQVYGQLEKAQLENVAGNLANTLAGLLWFDSVTSKAKMYDGGAIRTLVDTDSTQTLTGKTLTGNILGSFTPNGVNTITVPATTGTIVTDTFAQTLTNKTINGGVFDHLTLTHQATPAAPAAGRAQLYFKNDNLLYGQNSSGTEFPIGSGSGGGLDVFYSEPFITTKAADFSNGNSSTFLGGGAFAGALANETVAPLSGISSIKYTQAAGSLNDYTASAVISVPLAARGTQVGIKFPYMYNGSDNDIKVVIYDVTNAQVLSGTLDLLSTASSVKFFQTSVFIPTTCTQIRYGFQVVVLNSAKILYFDNVELSTNPFIYANISNTTPWETVTVTGSWVTNATYTAKRQYVGGSVVYDIMVETSGAPTATALSITLADTIDTSAMVSAVASVYNCLGVSQVLDEGVTNYTDGSVYYGGGNTIGVTYKTGTTTSSSVTATAPITFGASDKVRIRTFLIPTSNRPASISNVVTPQNGDDSYVRLLTGNDWGSTNTNIRRFLTTNLSSGQDITYADSVANGASLTINNSGLYAISYTEYNVTGNRFLFGVSKNSTQLTTNIELITDEHRLAIGMVSGLTTAYTDTLTISCTAYLERGDIIRPHTGVTAESGGDTSGRVSFTITKIGYKSLSAVPVAQVVHLKDVRASGVAGGSFTSGSYQTRTLNTVEGDTSLVTLAANQFTLPTGKYLIEGVAQAYFCQNHKLRLRNITDSTDSLIGLADFSYSSNMGSTAFVGGTVEITSTKVFELQHRCAITRAADGFGLTAAFGDNEVYAHIKITKVR